MAGPKKAAPKMSVNKWDEDLAKFAQESVATEESVGIGGNMVSVKGGRLSYNGGEIPGNKMNVIIIDYVLGNAYYDEPFDVDNPSSPVCFAFGRDDKQMAPHEKSAIPQHHSCKGCPMNEFGSADRGKGKACANTRRLALITEDMLEDMESAQVAFLKVSVTSVKAWAGYVQQLSQVLKRPPFAVITEISVVPDAKTQFKLQFKLVSQIDDGDSLAALMQKNKEVKEIIEFPYAPPAEKEEEPPKKNAKFAGKAAVPKVAPKGRR